MPYSDAFLLFFGVLCTLAAAYSLWTGRFKSIEYDEMTGTPAMLWGTIWLVAGITLCAGVLFDIKLVTAPFRWFLEVHG